MPSTVVELNPINRVMLCQNVPFDSTYTHTTLFGSKASQLAYFQGKAKFTWENLTPSRFPNQLRLPVVSSQIYDCNYIAFQNANFGDKWFYAFIKEVKYENPNVATVLVELDVFQTWQFDFTVGTSYVIREHPTTDRLGEHTLLEPIAASEFVDEAAYKTGHLDTYDLVLMYAQSDDSLGDGIVGGIFTGLTYMRTPMSSPGAMLDLLQSLNSEGKIDNIVASFIMPSEFYTTGQAAREINITVPKEVTTLGDYTPRNKKLLCYPYNMMNVNDSQGHVNTYRYEYFSNISGSAIFTLACGMGTQPEVVLFPHSYNGKSENFQETMSLSGYPQFAFIHDVYKNWLAQNGNTFALNQMKTLIGGDIAMKTGDVKGMLSAGLDMASQMTELARMSNQPNQAQGQQGSNTMVAIRAKDFYFYQHHVREDYAACIDDYFDRFGYLTNRLKVPNMTGRPSYNYVQCVDPDITGNVPLNDINVVKAAFERGITFWHNAARMGDYSLRNRPEEEG